MKSTAESSVERLLDEIRDEVRATSDYTGRTKLAERVIEAIRQVPRHAFVPDDWQSDAYCNSPLPIGHAQTISQPYIVALMTDLIQPRADDVVLEVGTGSGYQAAGLASLVKHVYSLEIIEALATAARERLQRLGYANVKIQAGNGCFGWPEHAPYDAVLVTAAAPQIPQALIEQLKVAGAAGRGAVGCGVCFAGPRSCGCCCWAVGAGRRRRRRGRSRGPAAGAVVSPVAGPPAAKQPAASRRA